jgi:hypothetical protein
MSQGEPDRSESHADLSGSAHDVVQAGNIHGGVHPRRSAVLTEFDDPRAKRVLGRIAGLRP